MVLNRLRIGHTHVTHKYLMETPQVQPLCNAFGCGLAVKHLLVECPTLDHLRVRWSIPRTMLELLGENAHIFNLTSFLKDANLYFHI